MNLFEYLVIFASRLCKPFFNLVIMASPIESGAKSPIEVIDVESMEEDRHGETPLKDEKPEPVAAQESVIVHSSEVFSKKAHIHDESFSTPEPSSSRSYFSNPPSSPDFSPGYTPDNLSEYQPLLNSPGYIPAHVLRERNKKRELEKEKRELEREKREFEKEQREPEKEKSELKKKEGEGSQLEPVTPKEGSNTSSTPKLPPPPKRVSRKLEPEFNLADEEENKENKPIDIAADRKKRLKLVLERRERCKCTPMKSFEIEALPESSPEEWIKQNLDYPKETCSDIYYKVALMIYKLFFAPDYTVFNSQGFQNALKIHYGKLRSSFDQRKEQIGDQKTAYLENFDLQQHFGYLIRLDPMVRMWGRQNCMFPDRVAELHRACDQIMTECDGDEYCSNLDHPTYFARRRCPLHQPWTAKNPREPLSSLSK